MKISVFFLILFAGFFGTGTESIFAQVPLGSRTLPLPAPLMPGSRSFSAPLTSNLADSTDETPEEYEFSEFPLWAHDLSRFGIITVGAFPITFLFSSLVYDYTLYAASNFNTSKSPGSQRGNNDILIMLSSAAGIALVIATVDLLINVSRRNKVKKTSEQPKVPSPTP